MSLLKFHDHLLIFPPNWELGFGPTKLVNKRYPLTGSQDLVPLKMEIRDTLYLVGRKIGTKTEKRRQYKLYLVPKTLEFTKKGCSLTGGQDLVY